LGSADGILCSLQETIEQSPDRPGLFRRDPVATYGIGCAAGLAALTHLACGSSTLPPIRALAYCQPTVEELLAYPMPGNYLESTTFPERRR
jgi:hypothetical protein